MIRLNELQQHNLRQALLELSGMKSIGHKQPLPSSVERPREGGHAPATKDNRFPRMVAYGRRNGRARVRREEERLAEAMGGKSSKGTKKDKRLKKNKGGK